MSDPVQRLAGVTALSVRGRRGELHAYVFDPHRLAFPVWAHAVGAGDAASLLTFDRHLDLVKPAPKVPERSVGLRALDEFARYELDVRNYDHILAAMEAGVVANALIIARTSPVGAASAGRYVDARGGVHEIAVAPTLDAALQAGRERVLSGRVLLDFDLDCFTTLSDADPTTAVPWPRALIREHVLPLDSEHFWDDVLARTVAMTFAREPAHCGGIVAGDALFLDAAEVIFRELLGADLP